MVLDGQIVALNKEGYPDFAALQKNTGETRLAFYLFDQGYDLHNLPLIELKKILSQVIPFNYILKYSDHFEGWYKVIRADKRSTHGRHCRQKNTKQISTRQMQQ